MTDIFDHASELEELHRQRALESHKSRESSPSDDCVSCGAIIPQARKKALPECNLCIGCATIKELRRKP
ncbi:TraR/DksA family transcriptional regulator [Aliikangiella marina]|uniref:TraR/DksA family transcriptional regulator n=1 Tax=Aliikangiella marina TaxID=1712262 RepID=A0A545THF1_9GAMM|nr:TraR/DksA family transcriptional regulator [Aliikangiella marina]